jgi:putative salt-induced outer membrane protein YdiY
MRTRSSSVLRATVALLFVAVFASAAMADEVTLQNGDRISGNVVELQHGTLKFDTGHGSVDLPWSDVASIIVLEPVVVTVTSQPPQTATVESTADGRIEIGDGPVVRAAEVVGLKRPQARVVIKGGADVGIITTGGNTDVNSLRIGGELVARVHDNRYTTNGALNHASDAGQETAHNSTGSFRYDRFLTPKLYLNGSSIFTSDRFRDLDRRSAFGAALGYQLFDDARMKLGLEGGYGYVIEDYSTQPDTRYHSVRETTSFDLFLAGKRINPFHRNDTFFGFTGNDNLFVNTRNGVRLTVVGGVVATIGYDVDYDKSPAPGRKTTDHSTGFTFGYRF